MSSYPEYFVDDLKSVVVGKRIVAAKDNIVTLDDGTKYALEGSSDCCAWAGINVIADTLANSEHVITAVYENMEDSNATWVIMADAHKVLQIEGEWNESSGYYFYGFSIEATNA